MQGAETSNLDRLKGLYADWERGDFSRNDLMHPDVETRNFGAWPEGRHGSKGIDAMSEGTGEFLAAWERPFRIEAEKFEQKGDRILVLIRWRGRGKGSGIELDAEGAHLWTFREGSVVLFETFRDRDEALAAFATA